MTESLWGVWCVWLRYFAVFRKSFPYYLTTSFLEPVLYLISFGFGLGTLVSDFQVDGETMSYQSFVFSGIIAQTVLFQGFFEGAYGGFFRLNYQRVFQAISSTPVTLNEVVWAELLWDASKATLAAMMVTAIGVTTGNFIISSLLFMIPVCFVSALLFGALGLCAAAYSTNIDQLSYPQFLFIFPMFLFCGVFYPIDVLPGPLPTLVWILPLTSVTSIMRTITLGLPFQPLAFLIALAWAVAAVVFARRTLVKRLVK
jgi:lipooligosaccharide transport system permease protein